MTSLAWLKMYRKKVINFPIVAEATCLLWPLKKAFILCRKVCSSQEAKGTFFCLLLVPPLPPHTSLCSLSTLLPCIISLHHPSLIPPHISCSEPLYLHPSNHLKIAKSRFPAEGSLDRDFLKLALEVDSTFLHYLFANSLQ